MSGSVVIAAVLTVAVLLAWVRVLLWQRRAPVRAARWRIVALLALQPMAAGLLFRTLVPPAGSAAAETLVVATAGAPRLVVVGEGERLVALPEATGVSGAARAPDLGTALRRYPAAARLRIVGEGLEARDRDAARRVSLAFAPAAPPRGLAALQPPAATPPGAVFRVAARIADITGGAAELIDPAGRIVDRQPVTATGNIVLTGTARGPGATLFNLRVRDARNALVEQAAVPVWTEAPPTARLMILAGAPGPEVKFLRRWAADAGTGATTRIAAGGGAVLGDAPVPITGAALSRVDALIVDDRAWAEMGAGSRGAIGTAVRGGMGLVVRVTGAVPRGWQVLGLGVGGGAATTPVTLPATTPSEAALSARRGPGTRDVPSAMAGARDAVPALTRQAMTIGGAQAIPVLRDARGTVLAVWQAAGRGRVAVVTLQDSFALVTSGHADRHAEIWSTLVSAVAREGAGAAPTIDPTPRAGERMAICGARDAKVIPPGGTGVRLLVDPATGRAACAGYWPQVAGWHRLATTSPRDFYVYSAGELPALRANERREGTMRLVGDRPTTRGAPAVIRGSSWPWFAAWLIVAGVLWWLERQRHGRAVAA